MQKMTSPANENAEIAIDKIPAMAILVDKLTPKDRREKYRDGTPTVNGKITTIQ